MPALLKTDCTAQRVTSQKKIERFLPRETVLEMAIERSAIQEADARLSRVDADARAVRWALDTQGVPLTVIGGELAIDEAAWQRGTEYVCRHADEIVAARMRLPDAIRLAVICFAARETRQDRQWGELFSQSDAFVPAQAESCRHNRQGKAS